MPEAIADHELFLSLNYVPRLRQASLDWMNWDDNYDIGNSVDQESWWVRQGIKTLKSAISAELRSTRADALHVVLLSGGLDSRAILGELLERLPSSQIVTATYGMPGTWDLQIAKTLARKLHLHHVAFNLLDERWDLDRLADVAERLDSPVSVYQSHVRRKINDYFGNDCVYWSGFLGGHIAGQDLPLSRPKDRIDALSSSLAIHSPCKYRGEDFWNLIFCKMVSEIPWDSLQHTEFDRERQFEFGVRQVDYLRPLVLVNGFEFKTPYTSKQWVNFMGRVPRKWLYGKYLFSRIVVVGYEKMARMPAILTAGMPLTSSKRRVFVGKVLARANRRLDPRNVYHCHPRTNYVDWGEALRRKGTLQETVCVTLESLGERGLVSKQDIARWWTDHLERRANNTTLLMNLSSLELLVQAGKIGTAGACVHARSPVAAAL
jgi:hypothetical protein